MTHPLRHKIIAVAVAGRRRSCGAGGSWSLWDGDTIVQLSDGSVWRHDYYYDDYYYYYYYYYYHHHHHHHYV